MYLCEYYTKNMETVLFAIISLMAGLLIAVVVMQKRAKRTQEQFQRREEELLQARDNAVASLYNVEGELKVSKERVALLEQSLAYFKESRKEDLASAQKEFEEKLEKLELLFKEKATEILKEKSRDLSQLNEGNLKNVVEPLSQKMEQFRKAVEESKEKSLENTTKVEEQIKAMKELQTQREQVRNEQMQQILTPEQYDKYLQMQDEQRERMRQMRGRRGHGRPGGAPRGE